MHKRRIYVASSWRNDLQPGVVHILRGAGHEVYDFKNPPGHTGFSWRQTHVGITDALSTQNIEGYLAVVQTDVAKAGFKSDKDALDWCDTCILVLPCGRSAHLEAGYAAGQGKDVYFLLSQDKFEPELMYLLGTASTPHLSDILDWMDAREPGSVVRWHEENGGRRGRIASHALRLLRETVELTVAAGATLFEVQQAVDKELGKAISRKEFGTGTREDIAEEWADCAILLEVFRKYASIEGYAAIRKKVDVLWQRQWQVDNSGVLWRPNA